MAHQEVSILASDGKATVSSLQLAEHFGINHKNVLRDIRAIVDKIPSAFTKLNFELSGYPDPTGRTLPCYTLTRDGFTLLAMGYNSARAIQWKLKYIAAFNQLESQCLAQAKSLGVREGLQTALAVAPEKLARLQKALAYLGKGLSLREVALLMGVSPRSVRTYRQEAKQLGLGV